MIDIIKSCKEFYRFFVTKLGTKLARKAKKYRSKNQKKLLYLEYKGYFFIENLRLTR
jgi:hypothetical protein